MKILLWSAYALPHIGGLEVMVHTLAVSLKNAGHDVFVLASGVQADFEEYVLDGVSIAAFPFIYSIVHKNLSCIKECLQKTEQFINTLSPDVIHLHCLHEILAFYQTRTLEKCTIPVVLTLHGLLEQENYASPACVRLLNRANSITAVSKALRKDFLALQLAPIEVKTVYNALIVPHFPITPINIDGQHIVMVGRLSKEKGFSFIFEVIKQVVENFPHLRVTLVGGGPDIKILQALKNKLGLNALIQITDFISHELVYEYIDSATFVVMPSSYESFGLVALEAAMRGRAIIASDVMGLPEVVEHNKTGFLVEPNNVEAWRKAIEFLLTHPERIHELGFAAYEKSKQFSVEKMTEQYLEVYHGITASG